MPKQLSNPASRHINVNFSLDGRADDCLTEESKSQGKTKSALLNSILKSRYGIVS